MYISEFGAHTDDISIRRLNDYETEFRWYGAQVGELQSGRPEWWIHGLRVYEGRRNASSYADFRLPLRTWLSLKNRKKGTGRAVSASRSFFPQPRRNRFYEKASRRNRICANGHNDIGVQRIKFGKKRVRIRKGTADIFIGKVGIGRNVQARERFQYP